MKGFVIIFSHLGHALLTCNNHLSSVRNSPKYRKEQFKFFVLYNKHMDTVQCVSTKLCKILCEKET
jgi:hypothetical protein